MNDNSKTIGKKGYGVNEYVAFTGHVIIPLDVDRTKYIKDCFKKGTLMIKSVDNQIEKNVQIDKGSIHYIEFPSQFGEVGTAVFCVRDTLYRKSKVVCILQTEDEQPIILEERQFRIFKESFSNFVDFDLSGKGGTFRLVCNSNKKGEKSFLKICNDTNEAEFDLDVQGDLNVNAEKSVNLKTPGTLDIKVGKKGKQSIISIDGDGNLSIQDQFKNKVSMSESGVKLETESTSITVAKENVSIKNKKEDFAKLFGDLVTEILAIKVLDPISGVLPLAPDSIAKVNLIKERISLLFN
jgi:hypothetical protein